MFDRLADIGRFGEAAIRIRDAELTLRDLSVERMRARGQGRREVEARQAIAYRVWTETDLTLLRIARLIGRCDHSAAIHAILAGAAVAGRPAARVSDLRDHVDPVDWAKLAYAAAGWRERRGLTPGAAGITAGIGRGEWRRIEAGRSVSAATLLSTCRAIGFDPMTLISHETAVKHGDRG